MNTNARTIDSTIHDTNSNNQRNNRRPTAAIQQRPRATAFDAARSGSWHYYSPVPRRSQSEAASTNIAQLERPLRQHVPATSSNTVFDAANPATWTRTVRTTTASIARPHVRNRTRHVAERHNQEPHDPQTLADWQTYLSSTGIARMERQAIMSDVIRAMRQSNLASSSETSTPRASSPSYPSDRRQPRFDSPFVSILDDPDFGDTSSYWESLASGTPSSSTHRWMHGHVGTEFRPRRAEDSQAAWHPMPRQPTHLNHPGLVPDFHTVRRAPSIVSFASNGTLPEYRVDFDDCHSSVLPDYRSRASFEIEVST